jgi:1-deoxy-D-xylulose-5-phosphate synthase
LTLPDIFIDQDAPERMYDTAGLNGDNIYDTVKDVIGRSEKTIIDLNPKRA